MISLQIQAEFDIVALSVAHICKLTFATDVHLMTRIMENHFFAELLTILPLKILLNHFPTPKLKENQVRSKVQRQCREVKL